jgi:hypothetical protein
MLTNQLRNFDHKYYYSIIDRDDGQSIPDYYATNIENFIIRDRGEIEMRDGLTARGSSPSATNLGEGLLKTPTYNRLVRVVNGAANTSKFQYSDDGTTWSDISGGGSKTTNAKWVMAQGNNNLYAVNGVDTPVKYDGSTMSTVAAIPQSIAIVWWKNFMWVFGNPTYKDRLYFSNVNDPETWGGSDYLNINLGDSSAGLGLCGTAGLTGRLYCGKERSVWFVTGTSGSNWAIQPLTFEHGVVSHESMVEVKNDVWCVDLEGNIRGLYRTTEDNPFTALRSEDIQQTIAYLNKSSIRGASAKWFNNFVMFFLPNGVDSYNSIVLVYDTLCNEKKGGWVKFTGWRIARATVFQESNVQKLYLHDARSGNGQTYEWTGTSDNGTAIICKYESKIYDFGMPNQLKRYFFSYQYANPIGNYATRFYTSIDRFYYALIANPSLLGTGNKLLGLTWTLGVDKLGSGGIVKVKIPFTDNGGSNYGYTCQVKLECESSSVKMKLRNFTIHLMPHGLR